jgi:glucosamine-phosphate N-acetyltransferase
VSGVVLRRAVLADFPAVLRLLGQLWPDQELDAARLGEAYRRGVEAADQEYLVAEGDGRVVGFASLCLLNSLWQAGNLGHIMELVVDEESRGRGIGTQLLEALIARAKERGCARIELDSAFHRAEAHRFYESRGFVRRAYWFSKPI